MLPYHKDEINYLHLNLRALSVFSEKKCAGGPFVQTLFHRFNVWGYKQIILKKDF